VSAADAAPLDADGFSNLMAPFAPFELTPEVAVAVSGGRDSLALALLALEWTGARGGRAVALIVDHGLRPESAAEAAETLQRLAGLAIDGIVLRWSGAKPGTRLQEAARSARYRLLSEECRRRGILHLLVAHHAEDQAETVRMRADRESGADGLAGMAALVEFPEMRLLRPLLPVSRARLTATLVARSVRWIDDPSNTDPRFERARLRLRGHTPPGSCLLPSEAGEERAYRERQLAHAAVEAVEFDEAGQAAVDRTGFARLDSALQARLLSRLVQRIGGRDHPPRRDRLERAAARLAQPAAGRGKSGRGQDFTLSRCRLLLRQVPWSPGLRWLVRPEKGETAAQPLVPAAFFACGAAANNHLQ